MQKSDDFISQLPDDILISIISFIPTKEALTTRILSKRWRHLFQFMSDLTFVPKRKYPRTCCSDEFLNGVRKVLQRHSVYIRSFAFSCCLPESCAHTIEQCIFSLGDLRIQKLNLCLVRYAEPTRYAFPFSCHLLSLMPSLQYFKLSSCTLHPSLTMNPCKSLKTIRLSDVSASPGSLEWILSNCLSLCTLIIKSCKVPSKKLCFPRLVNLQLKCILIHDCLDLEEIDLYAANLTTFDLDCKRPVNLILDYVPQLQTVYLCSKVEDVPYFCGRLAKYVPGLKTLLLDDIEDPYQDDSIAMGINMFTNLKRLELSVCETHCNLDLMIRVVHACTRLEEFQLAACVEFFEWPEEDKQAVVHSQLKVVEISGFGELRFVAYILRSAVKLQHMIISCYQSVYMGRGQWEELDYPPTRSKKWSVLYKCIQQIKLEAVSKTLQVVALEIPPRKPKLF